MIDIYFNNTLVTSYKVKKIKTAIKKAAKDYPELVKRGIIVQRRLNIDYAPKTLET